MGQPIQRAERPAQGAPAKPRPRPNPMPAQPLAPKRRRLMNGYQEPAVPQPQDEHSSDDGEATDGFDLYVSYDSCI